jgi:hypothetical protein
MQGESGPICLAIRIDFDVRKIMMKPGFEKSPILGLEGAFTARRIISRGKRSGPWCRNRLGDSIDQLVDFRTSPDLQADPPVVHIGRLAR